MAARTATEEEEAWLDAEEFLDLAHNQWLRKESEASQHPQPAAELVDQDEAEIALADAQLNREYFEAYQMMRDVREASAFLVHPELARKATLQQLSMMRLSAVKLVSVIDQALQLSIENERNAALQQVESIMQVKQELEAVARVERMRLQSEVAQLKEHEESLLEMLEQEKDKSTCRICFLRARDVIVLPCMHFDYCHVCLDQHQRSRNTCPSCRSPMSGTLKCNLTIS